MTAINKKHALSLRLCGETHFQTLEAKRMAQSVNFIWAYAFMMFYHKYSLENGMFRAIVALLFIVLILPSAALVASLTMKALGVSGLPGYMVGFPVFIGILTAAVMLLAALNDRINNRDREQKMHHRTSTNGAH